MHSTELLEWLELADGRTLNVTRATRSEKHRRRLGYFSRTGEEEQGPKKGYSQSKATEL